MQRCGIIEVGTRGIRLLVAQVSRRNSRGFEVLRTKGGLVNLGENLSPESPAMTEDRMRAAATMVEEFFREAADFQPDHIVVLATEVLRRASNVEEFLDKLPEGLPVFILKPPQEAALSYRAAADSFRGHNIRGGELRYGPLLLVDLGGGSAEIVAGLFGSSPRETSIASTLHLAELGSVGMQSFFDNATGTVAQRIDALEQRVRDMWKRQPELIFGNPRTAAQHATDDDEANGDDAEYEDDADDADTEGETSPSVGIVALGSAATELAWRLRGASPQSFRSRDVHGQRVTLGAARDFAATLRDRLPTDVADLTDEQMRDMALLFGSFVFDTILSGIGADYFRVCGFGLRFGAAAALLEGGQFPPEAPEPAAETQVR